MGDDLFRSLDPKKRVAIVLRLFSGLFSWRLPVAIARRGFELFGLFFLIWVLSSLNQTVF
jgi:hypothetical protein